MNPAPEPAVADDPPELSLEALDAELDELGEALAAATDGDERAELRVAVGVNLLDRYQLGGAVTDLDEAVDHLSEALAAGSPGHPDRADWSALLGVAHGLRYDLAQAPADRDAGIQALAQGLDGRPADDTDLATFRMVLGNLYAARYEQTGAEKDIDQAIGHLAEVVGPVAAGSGPPGLVLALGRLLWARGTTGSRPQDRDAAVGRFRQAVDQLPPDDPDRWQALLLCGSACLERGVNAEALRWDGGADDLETIVDCFTELLPLLPKPGVPRPRVVAALGFARFQRAATGSGAPDDLESALGLLEEAADTLDDVAEHLPNFRTVALSLLDGCRRGFHPRGMRLVLKLLTRVADELPEGDPLRVEAAAELGVATVLAFDLGQLPSGLDPAVERLEGLVATPGELPQAGLVHGALGAVLARRAMEGTHPGDIDRGIEHLERALALLGPDHRERPGTNVNLAAALYARFQQRHQASDLDAADERLRAAEGRLNPGSPQWAAAKTAYGGILLVRANYRQDAQLAEEAIEVLQQSQEVVPPSSPLRPGIDQALGMALLLRGQLQDRPGDQETAVDLLQRAAAGLPPDAPMGRAAKAMAGMVKIVRADPDRPDVASFDDAVTSLREVVTSSPRQDPEQVMNMAGLGGLLFGRHMARYLDGLQAAGRGGAGAVDLALDDLNEAIRWMEAAAELVPDRAATAWWTPVSLQLCMALRRRSVFVPGDRRRSREVGLEGLRGFAWRVLLQSGTEDAMAAARDAARQALEVADWCLADGALDQAVEALESGRGLVLHAATASASIAGRLRDAGHPRLAAEWEATLGSPAPQPLLTADLGGQPDRLAGVPSDLPFRILQALEGADAAARSRAAARPTGPGARLLVPPTVDEIRAALGRLDADALVYLVPTSDLADDGGPAARAVVVRADGEPVQRDLARLDTGPGTPLDDYVAALEGRRRVTMEGTDEDRRAALGSWRRSLERLCDWAWRAVEPLLQLADGWQLGRPARLVLVPVGLLGLVPWHAARTPAAGGHRYAVQRATFSSAASARLLCEVAARTVLPRDGQGLLVGDPTGTLHHAVQEALALRGAFYPQAAYLGQPGDVAVEKGTPRQVLRRLTGAQPPPVQHLACHAFIEDSPARTHLLLAGMQQLTVGDLLIAAGGRRPEAPGATVSLAACTTNLAGRQHDESLTLATAFLVAGSASVVGSLWQVPDLRTALLMFMTHHYLQEAGATARDALRRAQLWMLDPGRAVPDSMPDALARLAHTTDLTAPHGWAGFTHQGW